MSDNSRGAPAARLRHPDQRQRSNAHRRCPAIKPLGHCPGLLQAIAFHPGELATLGKLYDRVQRSVGCHMRRVLRIVVYHGRTRLTHVKASNSSTAMHTKSRLNPPSQL
jgi:hypothetical protein